MKIKFGAMSGTEANVYRSTYRRMREYSVTRQAAREYICWLRGHEVGKELAR